MNSGDGYIGCQGGLQNLRALNDKLNAKVAEQVNQSQELVMLNNFSRETSETQIKKCFRERISDIESWQWVLEDLSKRLVEAIQTLKYEHNAVNVVVNRIQSEIEGPVQEASKPGALGPLTDAVEDAIMQEYNFLRDQKKKFESMIPVIEKQINSMLKTKRRIETDILNKKQAISVDQSCSSLDRSRPIRIDVMKRKIKRGSPVRRWENRCAFLKRSGLQALSTALVTRQQIRGSRVHLSIAAQAYAARVDSAIRRRLHSNKIKLQDLKWQKEESLIDYKTLAEELTETEKNLVNNMEQERLIEARLADRALRPGKELTKDEVDRKLKDELSRLKSFSKELRINLDRITSLQNNLTALMAKIEDHTEDLVQIITLDDRRLKARLGDCECNCSTSPINYPPYASRPPSPGNDGSLFVIKEEDEAENDDGYPLSN